MRHVPLILFIFSITSLLLYAFANLTLWSSTQAGDLRSTVLFLFHVFGLGLYPIRRWG